MKQLFDRAGEDQNQGFRVIFSSPLVEEEESKNSAKKQTINQPLLLAIKENKKANKFILQCESDAHRQMKLKSSEGRRGEQLTGDQFFISFVRSACAAAVVEGVSLFSLFSL